MIESFASLAPTRALDWIREQRHAARRAFADTEWADTEASVFVDDPLAPPAPMHVLAVPSPTR